MYITTVMHTTGLEAHTLPTKMQERGEEVNKLAIGSCSQTQKQAIPAGSGYFAINPYPPCRE
jgi:hypothetical protein